MRCILHIGTEKTGTTSLQHWLYENRSQLSAAGVFLSQHLSQPNNRVLPLYFQACPDHWTKERGLNDRLRRREFLEPSLAAFRNEVRHAGADHHTFLITSEHLHSRLDAQPTVDELHHLLESLFSSITVVTYVRNQADAVLSSYSTALRGGGETRSLAEAASAIGPEDHPFDHLQSAERWSSAFGRSALQFRIYDHCVDSPTGVIGDFAEHVLQLAALPMEPRSLNKSLSPDRAAAYRQINARFPRWPKESPSGQVNRRLRRMLSDMPVKAERVLTMANAPQFLGRFEERNQLFFDKYGDGTNYFAPDRWVSRSPSSAAGFDDEFDPDALISSLLQQIELEPPAPVQAAKRSRFTRLKFWRKTT